MTLLVEKGTFAKTTSTSVPVDQTVTLSNGSLTPKLVILWTDGQTTNDGTYVDDLRMSYGYSDGTNDSCIACRTDESGETESYVFHNDAVISLISLTAGSEVSIGELLSFGAGNFHINWTTQTDTNASVIHYMVAGGTDITNVSVVNTTVGNTTTGNHSYTGSGGSWTPDFALMMTGSDGTTTANTLSVGGDSSLFCLGAAKSASNQWVIWGRDETIGTADCDMYHSSSNCMASCSTTAGSITFLADFQSFDNAAGGGITVNVSDGSPSANKLISFLLVKGGSWDCGAFQQRNGTGTQNVTITTGVDPALVFLGGINSATSGSVQTSFYLGIGGSDGTNEGATYAGNTNGNATFAAVSSNLNTKCYRIATPNATAASSTTNAECDMNDMATAGQFTLDWTTADATQRQMVYWSLGSVSSTAYERAPATETTSISDSVVRVYGVNRTIDTETVSTSESITRLLEATRNPIETVDSSESLTRLLEAQRIIDTETTAITDSAVRVKGMPRSITETIDSSDSITRMLAANRTLEESTSISDSISRLIAANRSLEAETTAMTDSVTRVFGVVRTLEENTAISDSVARIYGAVRTIEIESVSVVDAVVRLLEANRTLLETTSITDLVDRLVQGGASQNYERSITETVTISESLSRMYGAARTLEENMTISDSVTRLLQSIRQMLETVLLVDSLTRQLAASRSVETETVSITDSLTRLLTRVRTIVENIDISESITRAFVGARPIIETINISDSLARLLTPFEIPTRLKKIRTWLTNNYSEDDPSL